jgi:hypothetical protein
MPRTAIGWSILDTATERNFSTIWLATDCLQSLSGLPDARTTFVSAAISRNHDMALEMTNESSIGPGLQ